jgi:2-methylisocitrate lyase-like PEP mutase family enzyme
VSVDSERLFAETTGQIAETVALLAAAGAAGLSIEDYDPATDSVEPLEISAARVGATAEAARRHGLVLTARAENTLYGHDDLDDTIARLVAYRDAGADVLYAPALITIDDIRRVVDEVGAPINVLTLPGTPPLPVLAQAGVARVSVGSMFAWAAYGALPDAANELMGAGTTQYASRLLSGDVRNAAFG